MDHQIEKCPKCKSKLTNPEKIEAFGMIPSTEIECNYTDNEKVGGK